ncbi:DUF4347 domain-containing protein [Aliarcobacter butzleri]|uniref:DUF4347 domain-containing protein n=1 Tax=Aliarcobacter butzleri TaxID=28197 RepID=UPI00344CB6D2
MKRRNLKKPVISVLEQRVLFDGAAVATAVDVLDNSSFSSSTTKDSTTVNDVTNNSAENSVHKAQAVQGFEKDRREVAFVDITVKDYQTLVDGVGQGVETYLVSSMDEIKSILQNQTNIDSIHILSHGKTGEITVGNDILNKNTLQNFDEVLESMKSSLTQDGDILLYGCNVGNDGKGQEFIDLLASETQADIAASNDITGSNNLGGDWDLEAKSGTIETTAIVVNEYNHSLANLTTDNDGGFTSSSEISGSIATTDKINFARGPGSFYNDLYTLSGVANGTQVKLYIAQGTLSDPYIQVTDSNGTVIVQDDDSGDSGAANGYDAYVKFTWNNNYTIRATTYNTGAVGTYTIYTDTGTLIIKPDTAPTFTSSPVTLNISDTPDDNSIPSSSGLLTATDAENDALNFSGGGTNSFGTLSISANGSWTWAPNNAYINSLTSNATTSYNVLVSDGINITNQTFTINITSATNDAPVITSSNSVSFQENTATNVAAYTITATDAENNTLTYSISGTDSQYFNINSTTGQITFKNSPDYETKTSYSLMITALETNGTGLSASKMITISIANVNEPPIIESSNISNYTENGSPVVLSPSLTIDKGETSTLASAQISISSGFISGDILNFVNDGSTMGNIVATYNSATGVLTLTSSGATATLAQWQSALRSISYHSTSETLSLTQMTRTISWKVSDGNLESTVDTSTLKVTGVNDAPTISVSTPSGFTETTTMDKQTLSQNGTVTFSDVDNNVNITYSYNNDISWSGGTLNSTLSSALIAGFNTSATNVSSGTTSWSYNVNNVDLNFLAAGETITLSYNVIATDIAGATAMTTITFTITGTNDAPVFGTVTTGPTTITAPTAGTTNPNAGIETFNNGLLRFGNGSIDSVNASTGMLEQPFYYKDGNWYQLTFSTYQLNMAIAADYNNGSAKTDVDWNLEGTVNLTPTFTNTTVNNSGFNSSTGTGTIVWTGEIVVGSAHLKVTNVYTLEAGAKYIKANTYIENIGSTSTENLRFWVGTRDDFVAGSDSPAKQKGNIVDGEFQMISNSSEQAKAIKIYTGTGANATAVLFYSTNSNVNTVIAPGYGWTTSNQYAPGIDPLNSVYNQSYDDGGYAMFTNLNNVATGQTVMFDWYYAAGAVSELSDITSSLEQATSTNLQENSSSLVLADDYTITDLDSTDSVNVTVSSVQINTPTGLTLPANYTDDVIKNMLQITSNPVIISGSTTGTVSWNFNSGTDYTFNFLGRGQTLTLLYTLTATDSNGATATTVVTISIDGANDAPTVVVDSLDSDVATISETNSTISTSGTLSITDPDMIDTSFSVSKSSLVVSGMTNGLTANTAALLNMLTVSTQNSDINWAFNSGNQYFNYLSVGETLTITYTIAVSDSSNAVTNKTITINITGTNDSVSLNTPATIYYTDTDGNDVFSATTSQLTASDVDRNTTFTYGIDNGTISGTTVIKTGTYGVLTLNTATGVYTYTPNSNAINALTSNSSETFTVTVNDGNGSIDTKSLVIQIESVNDAPLLGGNSSPNTFVENGSAVQVDSNITVTDLEGTSYDEGYVSFDIKTNKGALDNLSISSIGGISLAGANVKYGNTVIGTVDSILNGQNGKELRIHLNDNAYSLQVQALARAITFSNPSDNFNDSARSIDIKVNDGGNGGETSARYSIKTVTVNLQSVNDLPTINLGNSTFLVEKIIGQNDNGTLSLGNILSVADLDNNSLTVTIQTTNYGLITINSSILNGVNSSQIIGNGSRTVTITGTIEQINNTLNASNGITYVAGFGNDYITPGADYLKITAKDTLNGESSSQKLVMVLPAIPNIFSDNVVGKEDDVSNIIVNINNLVTDINDNGGTYVFGTGTPDITNSSGNITTNGSLTPFDNSTYIYDNLGKVIGYQLEHGKIILNEGKNRVDNTDFAKFTFIPNENWYGVQTFLYQFTSNDGEVSNIAQIAIFVTPVNDAPVISIVNNNITIDEDNPFVFENSNLITLLDLDVIDNTQILDLTLNVTNGKLELSQMTDLTVLEGANNSSIIKIRGSLASLQNAISGLKYTPNQDYNGSDTLSIKLNDNTNIGEGNSLEDIKTINFVINPVNDAPEFTDQTDSVTEGEQISGILPASDIDSSSITFSINGNAPTGFVLHNDGSYSFDSSSYDYIGRGETDTIIIPVTVTDAEGLTKTANFSITITGTNDAPTVSMENIDAKIPFGDTYTKDISNLFEDKDLSNVFTYQASNLPSGLTIDPNTGIISGRVSQSGSFVISITAIDSEGAKVTRTYNMLVVAPAQNQPARPDSTPTIITNNPNGENPNNGTKLNNYADNSNNSAGVINFSSSDGFVINTGKGFLDTKTSNNQESLSQNNSDSDKNLANTNNNNSNNSRSIQANVDLNVSTSGQVLFGQGSQDSFSIVGITIEDIKVQSDFIKVKVVDTNIAQSYVVTQIDGTALPVGLSFDPKTGNISGKIPADLDELKISIKAINSDGTTRVLNLKLDLKELKQKTQAEVNERFVGFKEQIAFENQKLDSYGSHLAKLFA